MKRQTSVGRKFELKTWSSERGEGDVVHFARLNGDGMHEDRVVRGKI